MAIFNYVAHLDGGGSKAANLTFNKPQLNIEVYGVNTDEIIQDLLNGTYENASYEMSSALGTLAAYGQIDELNMQLEEAGIDLIEMYGGEDSEAGNLIKTMLATSDDEPIEDFDANNLADELNKAMNGIGTDENVLIEILGNASYSPEQIQEICDAYRAKYGHELTNDISNDTSGKFDTLLSARLSGANDYIENTIRDDIEFNRDNSNNVAVGDAKVTETETKTGKMQTTTVYNANGESIGEIQVYYDANGNVTSRVDIEYVYDENGQIREQAAYTFDAQGNQTSAHVERKDENGNTVQAYSKYINEQGQLEERNVEYLYGDKVDPTLLTKSRETYTCYDENGEVLVSGEKESLDLVEALNVVAAGALAVKYLDEFNKLSVADKIAFLREKNVYPESVTYEAYWEEFNNTYYTPTEMSQEAMDLAYNEMLAKLDLMADEHGRTEKDKNDLMEKLKEAYQNKDVAAINEIYGEINSTVYPESNQPSLVDDLASMKAAKDFYTEFGVDEAKAAMTIADNYDPETMQPHTYGEMLLEQLYEVRKQYELFKENAGSFDSAISFANRLFDFGTSEDDVEAIFAKYESELRNLSNLDGQEFLSTYKALTGDDFSQSSLTTLQISSDLCEAVDNIPQEDLEKQAALFGINLENAWVSSQRYITIGIGLDMTPIQIENPDYGKIDPEKLKTLVKEAYLATGRAAGEIIEAAQNGKSLENLDNFGNTPGASISSPGNALEDYGDTVSEQRKFIIDLARTAVAALVAPSGILGATAGFGMFGGAVVSGFSGALVEALGHAANSDAIGDQNRLEEEFLIDITSGFASAFFQSIGGDTAKDWYRYLGIENTIAQSAFEKIFVKGMTGQVIKDDLKYIMTCLSKGKDIDPAELKSVTDDAMTEGLILGVCLFAGDLCTMGAKNWVLKVSQDGVKNWKDVVAERLTKTFFNTTARTGDALYEDGEFNARKFGRTTWKELVKSFFKSY